MSVNQSYSRVDTLELKALIVKKIGLLRAEKYFDHVRRLFNLKISKSEFNKLVYRTIGRENVSLHNHLICSIMKNACLSKVPPTRTIRKFGDNLNIKIPNGSHKGYLQSLYGDSFPPSPHKGRSPASRDRKLRDRLSPLGPFGKPQAQQQSPTELFSLGSRPPASVEDGEEVEQDAAASPGVQSRSPVTAPFGVFLNLGGSRKVLPGDIHRHETCQNSGTLLDTRSLRDQVKLRLEAEGIGVSMDCVNVLNNGLDVYLKRLIEPCIRLAGSRRRSCGSLLDFRAAMEMNPLLLGEDWVVQLEKICFHGSEE